VTKEHVIPRWVLEQLAPAGEGAPYIHRSAGRQWLAPGIDFTVKRVCKACNEGWMSRELEVPNISRLRPMLHDEVALLDAEARMGLSAWSYKTMAMALFRTSGPSYSSPAHLRYLHQHRRAPDEARVFLGRYEGPTDCLIDGYTQRFDLSPTPDYRDSPPDQILSGELFKLRLGPLLVMCLVGSGGRVFVKSSATEVGFDDRLIPIWPGPAEGDLKWPPIKSVCSDDEWKSLTRVVTAMVDERPPERQN
jgi:hypothetical protein